MDLRQSSSSIFRERTLVDGTKTRSKFHNPPIGFVDSMGGVCFDDGKGEGEEEKLCGVHVSPWSHLEALGFYC